VYYSNGQLQAFARPDKPEGLDMSNVAAKLLTAVRRSADTKRCSKGTHSEIAAGSTAAFTSPLQIFMSLATDIGCHTHREGAPRRPALPERV
jgi:hypothetical protein